MTARASARGLVCLVAVLAAACDREGHDAPARVASDPVAHAAPSSAPVAPTIAPPDTAYLPRPDEAGFVLPHPSGVTASIATSGASFTIGTRHIEIGLRSIAREVGAVALPSSAPSLRDGAVELDRSGGVVEWWRSLPAGHEHGVTIATRPEGEGELRLHVAVSGATPRAASSDVIALTDARGGTIARYTELHVLDARGATVPARFVVEGGAIVIAVDDAHAAYPLEVDPLVVTQEAAFMIPGGIGVPATPIGITSDGSRVVVEVGGGIVVFVRNGTSWGSEQALNPPSSGGWGYYYDVAISGDGLWVAAQSQTGSSDTQRTIEIWNRSGTTWTLVTSLSASRASPNAGALSFSADGSRLVAGASLDSYVFVRAGTSWSREATLVNGGASAVAMSDDGSVALLGGNCPQRAVRSGSTWTVYGGNSCLGTGATAVAISGDGRYGTASSVTSSGSYWMEFDMATITATAPPAFGAGPLVLNADASLAVLITYGMPDVGTLYHGISPGWTADPSTLNLGSSSMAPPNANAFTAAMSRDGSRVVVAETSTGQMLIFSILHPTGEACPPASAGCVSGFCVDGYCCNTACGGGALDCQACSGTLTGAANGTCAPLTPSNAMATTCRPSAGVCDPAETCVATSTSCPADRLTASGTVCRASAGTCDPAEACSGSSAACPADALSPSSMVCRASAGTCDVAENCTGSSAACPANVVVAANTTCRAAAGTCDIAEVCDGSNGACPGDTFIAGGSTCRASAGLCDVAETCSGSSAACPADGFRAASTVCRPMNGACDVADMCSGSSAACPDVVLAVNTSCRAAAGACDVGEVCDGISEACPGNAFASSGTVCRPAAGACDRVESCTGASAACPADMLQDNTFLCGPSIGVCDIDDYCDGVTTGCANQVIPMGTVCRPATGACDITEVCSGMSGACPGNMYSPVGTVCRAANGACDVAEACVGGPSCPPDSFAPSSTVCGPSMGACDPAEMCSGFDRVCPSNVLAAAGTVCNATTSGVCDAPDVCDGMAPDCPATYLGATHVCRPIAGGCDLAESCNGTSVNCPPDQFQTMGTHCGGMAAGSCSSSGMCNGADASCPGGTPFPAGTVCLARDTTNPCDVDDVCDGTNTGCPMLFAPSSTSCGPAPSGVCDAPDHCAGTSLTCVPTFVSGTICRAASGACDVAESCSGTAASCPPDGVLATGVVCRMSTASCDPAEDCDGTSTTCPPDVSTCTTMPDASTGIDAGPTTHDAAMTSGDGAVRDASTDASPTSDGSTRDASGLAVDSSPGQDVGTAPPPISGSCGCRAIGSGGGTTTFVWLVAAAIAWVTRRRRG